jgi:TRAP-type mannitol/chloroaromatic compound transport system substrate-binding protein
MATLASLKLSAAQKNNSLTGAQVRRTKMLKAIGEQIAIAKAVQAGAQPIITKLRSVTTDTGERTLVETNKRVKQWWFATDNGKLAINLRYGARMLELAKGKFAIEVASEKELVPTLEALKAIAAAGELDAAIETASVKLREGFGK